MTSTNQYSEEDVYKKLVSIIIKELDVKPDEIQPNVSFVDDLNADSLSMLELMMEIEEKFNIEIDDVDAEEIQTVKDATDCILKVLAKK
jgi:acyl carrier protein